ncbi:vWA domain-containing protein [Legionella spiritensis]|uniref:VWFA domain-containing protein n=1 Tax=Legionella spiritensis TaxID=452 RepID=A0A0W0ZBU2_LEGSP|nr:VWA domain-containing protein [Legionella spiritensis]KTD66262.1 hypothetical protein Lspi_0025 [Legionella spiritensis]SNV48381.1 TPR (repeat) domain protein [Legionella spiritensis]
MITNVHFLRPWWLLALVPLLILAVRLWRAKPHLESWAAVCDRHLLDHLIQSKGRNKRHLAMTSLFISAAFLIISLAGPSWSRFPVPSYRQVQPRVLILDMSDSMLMDDLNPNRLTRAKFKLHDLFSRPDLGQTGLIAYTGEPFIVSPLTEDAKTIDSLLSSLTPDIMPVSGQRLDSALKQAGQLINQAGFHYGQILVLTAESPSRAAIEEAETLAGQQIYTSVIPMLGDQSLNPLFQRLANAGQGIVVPFSDSSADLERWLTLSTGDYQFNPSQQNLIPVWRDEGRWFLIPALIFLLPVFRRGWLQRIDA